MSKSYPVYVPISIKTIDLDHPQFLINSLKRAGVDEVWMCGLGSYDYLDERIPLYRRGKEIFESEGFTTGIWIDTLAHMLYPGHDFTKQVLANGSVSNRICPYDEEFRRYFSENAARLVAETGIKSLSLDDDFRIAWLNDDGCFCPLHMKRYEEELGHPVTREWLIEELKHPGEVRDVRFKLSRESLLGYGKAIRDALDKVDPNVDVKLATPPAHWGCEGFTGEELARVLTHREVPVTRSSGGPYWLNGLVRNMANAIDFARREASYLRGKNINFIVEADSYPRPRYTCAANFVECFDGITRADGGFGGILKYCLDYYSSPAYEQGYIRAAEKWLPTWERVSEIFAEGELKGVRVWSPMDYLSYAELGEMSHTEIDNINNPSIIMLNNLSIPAVFEEAPVTLITGEFARTLPENMPAAILDLPAAKILTEKGIDVGLISDDGIPSQEQINVGSGCRHIFCDTGEITSVFGYPELHQLTVSDKAVIHSYFMANGTKVPGCWTYTNAQGTKFLVIPINAKRDGYNDGMIRNYELQKLILKLLPELGLTLPASCAGHPDLYIMEKVDGNELKLGLWNLFADEIEQPEIQLDGSYRIAEELHCSAKICGNRLQITGEIAPWGFAGLRLIKA